jgi:hypothetical protein
MRREGKMTKRRGAYEKIYKMSRWKLNPQILHCCWDGTLQVFCFHFISQGKLRMIYKLLLIRFEGFPVFPKDITKINVNVLFLPRINENFLLEVEAKGMSKRDGKMQIFDNSI